MFNEEDTSKHWDHHCGFWRSLVTEGIWAHLWCEGRGSAVSVLPVLGALGWGLPETHVRRDKLAALSGVDPKTLSKALGLLAARELITFEQPYSGVIAFQLSEKIYAAPDRNGPADPYPGAAFHFGAWCVFGGAWGLMTAAQRSIYVALLASTRYSEGSAFHWDNSESRLFDDRDEVREYVSAEDWALIEQLQIVQQRLSGYQYHFVRCAALPYTRLAEMTGMSRQATMQAVAATASFKTCAPFYQFRFADELLYHVPVRASRIFRPVFLNGTERWTSDEQREQMWEHVAMGAPLSRSDAKPKLRASRSYDYRNYEWSAEVWDRVRAKGYVPRGENRSSLLIGAYLVAMWHAHKRMLPIPQSEFKGTIGKQASTCIRYFDALHDHDKIAGMRAALEYVTWYVKQEEDEFLIDKNRNITLCFHPYSWRETYVPGSKGKKKKKGPRGQRSRPVGFDLGARGQPRKAGQTGYPTLSLGPGLG